ncbi:MAG: PLP-dependent transferase [Nannocystaceae bacterium]
MSPSLHDYLDPRSAPAEPPPRSQMGARTRELHDALDHRARLSGVASLHPDGPSVQRDLLGSAQVIAWQEGKAERLFLGESCWADLPHLYARYGTAIGHTLHAALRELEGARAAIAVECGMQAVALTFDVLMGPRAHAVTMRQVYNKSRAYLERLAFRVGGSVTIVDDGDLLGLAAAVRPDTALIFCETFTNPLTRAQDPEALVRLVREARSLAPELRLVVDDTIATPWSIRRPLLASGVDVVVAAGTKALGGQDRDLFGVIATDDVQFANQVMDLAAMRGGLLDWRRAEAIALDLPRAREDFLRRCEGAARIAAFLAEHPAIEAIFHPSRPDHVDAAIVHERYVRGGSLISFRIRGLDEAGARHFADVLAMSGVVRYALSFDGLATKVNHHKTVSEYFTPEEALVRGGIDRLIRLAVGVEDPEDLIAALNWALHHHPQVSGEAVLAWQRERAAELGLAGQGR